MSNKYYQNGHKWQAVKANVDVYGNAPCSLPSWLARAAKWVDRFVMVCLP